MRELKIHLWVLPRWFAAPVLVLSIILGAVLVGRYGYPLILAILTGLCLQAFSHSANTFLDFYWTKLDQGDIGARSNPKLYTTGQQLLATGEITKIDNVSNMVGWLGLSLVPLAFLPPVALIPWALIVPMTFWYSKAKVLDHPEIPLCLGFGPFALWLGMSASGSIDFLRGFMASIPTMLLWAAAEQVDQAKDWEPNWPKGARSSGMRWKRAGYPLGLLTFIMVILSLVSLTFLVENKVLPTTALISSGSLLLLVPCAILLDRKEKLGTLLGLLGIVTFQGLLVVGVAIS